MTRQAFDALRMPLDGICLIEASAGTGKTFSLAGLYLRLLIEQRLDVGQILVMTFTRAATQELRERIRLRLDAAARLAREPDAARAGDPEDALALALIRAADEPREALASRLGAAARGMDRASIHTIHGFSQQAAAEHAFDSALPFDRGEQVDDALVHEEVLRDYWRARALGDDALPGFLEIWPLPDKLAIDLRPWQTQPHLRVAGPDDATIGALADEARRLWGEQRQGFSDLWTRCEDQGALRKKVLKTSIEDAGGIASAFAALDAALSTPAAAPLLPAWTARLDHPDEFRVADKYEQLRTACTSHPLSVSLARLQGLARIAALRAARAAVAAEAESRKRRRRQFSFNDMIAALHRAVTDAGRGEALASALHRSWPWALVDEFQDTDPLQYEILRRIYAGRPHGGLFLIGDPKQAIYAFRGGDVHAYLAAARDAGEHAYSLATNYRSAPGLLHAVETLFRAPGEDAFLVQGIAFQHVGAGRDDDRRLLLDGAPQPAMRLWQLPLQDTRKPAAAALCLRACVAQIRQLLGGAARIRRRTDDGRRERPVEPGDIAVLVNTNQEASELQRALSAAGVAAVCLHRSSVYASDEAEDLLQVLRAAAAPTDEGRLRGALSGPLLGHRLSDLIALHQDEARWQRATARMQHAHEQWREHGVLAMLQGLIQDGAAGLLARPDGPRRLSNYLQLAELLGEAEPRCFGMDGLLHVLHEARREAGPQREPPEAEQLRLESDRELVRITTVHKAKGLEYELVLLPYAPWLGTGSPQWSPLRPPYRYHEDGASLIDILGGADHTERAVRERRAEDLRLLYVALTRAAVGCFLPWCAANGIQNSALASLLHRDAIPGGFWSGSTNSCAPLTAGAVAAALAGLEAAGDGHIAVRPPPAGDGPAPPEEDEATAGTARADLPARRPPWSVHSFSRLLRAAAPDHAAGRAQDEAATESPPEERPAPPPGHRLPELPAGTRFGEAVHALLEHAAPADWPAAGPLPDLALRATAQALRRQGLPADDDTRNGTAELVRATWHTPLPDIGPLAALPAHARRPEMEFHFRLGGARFGALLDLLRQAGYARALASERQAELLRGLMHGFIDLTVEADGRYYVIDYKTNDLGPGRGDYRPDALRAAIDQHHYDLQYLIYLTALHRHLAQRLPGYDPGRHLGGARYLFLRGVSPTDSSTGIHADRPNPDLILRLDALLDGGAA